MCAGQGGGLALLLLQSSVHSSLRQSSVHSLRSCAQHEPPPATHFHTLPFLMLRRLPGGLNLQTCGSQQDPPHPLSFCKRGSFITHSFGKWRQGLCPVSQRTQGGEIHQVPWALSGLITVPSRCPMRVGKPNCTTET